MLEPTDFEFVSYLLDERAAIQLPPGKEYLVESRIVPLAEDLGFGTVSDLIHAAQREGLRGALAERIVDAMTTNETSFLRDNHPFHALYEHVLPAALEHCQEQRSLRIWSAACSTGQEPLTISILLHEHFPQLVGAGSGWKVEILATDISDRVLTKARNAVYTRAEIERGLPEDLRNRYFEPTGREWRARDTITRLIRYRKLNLTEPWGDLGLFDVVFLRNVLIYFDAKTKAGIYERLARHLRPTGYLFLGAAERPVSESAKFERIEVPRSSCFHLT